MKALLTIFACCSIWLLASCASKRSEPVKKRAFEPTTARVANGEKIYMAKCQKCHPGGEAGLGIAINPNPAPRFLKKFQIRHGLGVMPAFRSSELSRADLQDVAVYLSEWKHY